MRAFLGPLKPIDHLDREIGGQKALRKTLSWPHLVALEALLLGASGWVSGLTSAFPRESVAMVAAARRGDWTEARRIYRWFMPLLHLDADHDLVQSIKLAEQIMGRGSERVRMPRLPLAGARRADVIRRVENCRATRPVAQPGAAA